MYFLHHVAKYSVLKELYTQLVLYYDLLYLDTRSPFY